VTIRLFNLERHSPADLQSHCRIQYLYTDNDMFNRYQRPRSIDRFNRCLNPHAIGRQDVDSREREPMSFYLKRRPVRAAVEDRPYCDGSGPMEAMLISIDNARHSGVGRHKLPATTVAIRPCSLVEIASTSWRSCKWRSTEGPLPRAADEIQNLATMIRIDDGDGSVALKNDHVKLPVPGYEYE
jgi:hypothetical protein